MLKWFICKKDGVKTEVEKCLESKGCRLRDRCMMWSMLYQISKERKWAGVPSVTQLIRGTCEAYLKLMRDYAVLPDNEVYKILGTKIHELLAKEHPEKLVEETIVVDGISMTPDEYDTEDGQNILTDLKVTGSYSVADALGLRYKLVDSPTEKYIKKTTTTTETGLKTTRLPGEPKLVKEWYANPEYQNCAEWALQLNKYRIGLEKIGFPVDKMRIQAIVRDGGTITATGRGVLDHSVIISIPRMDDDETNAYFERKKDALLTALKEKKVPTSCSVEERWQNKRCEKFCPVKEFCPHREENLRRG